MGTDGVEYRSPAEQTRERTSRRPDAMHSRYGYKFPPAHHGYRPLLSACYADFTHPVTSIRVEQYGDLGNTRREWALSSPAV